MHFLSTGRDDRVQRWFAGQHPERQLAPGETNVVRWQDSLESIHRKDHDAIVDMDWELEELERQIALSSFSCAQAHRCTRTPSVDSTKGCLDVTSIKQAPQLTDVSQETQAVDEAETSSKSSSRPLDRRREGRIISQPLVLPLEPQGVAILPPPSIQRSHTVPPPINTDNLGRTSGASSMAPPITFILQESASPLPSAMHFTPTPPDLEAFPSTPRSFGSLTPDLRNSEERARQPPELFLSPRLPNECPKSRPPLLTPSPIKPYSPYSVVSDASTPSLSAFPATPGSRFPHSSYFTNAPKGVGDNCIPPVTALPPPNHASISPGLSRLSMNRDKPLPPLVKPDLSRSLATLPRRRSATLPSSLPIPPVPKCSDDQHSESDRSVDGQLSSRFSVRSSRFSVSSDGSGHNVVTTTKSWAQLRARAYPTAGTRSRSGSVTTSRVGTPSRPNSRAETPSRANSRAETLSRANSRAETLSRANSHSGQHQHRRTGSTPHLLTRAHTIQEQEQEQEQEHPQAHGTQMHTPPSTPSPPPITSVRTLIKSMSRMGHGIKRSMSHNSQSKPRLTIHTQCHPSIRMPRASVLDSGIDGVKREGDLGVSSTPPASAIRRYALMTPATPSSVPLPPTPAVSSAVP